MHPIAKGEVLNTRGFKQYILQPKVCIHIGIVVSIVLTIFKFIAGIIGLSRAMVADALESLSDILATFIAYVGISIGARPADEEHPYGHGNAETIAASFISLIIFVVGGYVGFSAIQAIRQGGLKQPLAIALLAAVTTILVKELLFRYTIKVGRVSNNPAVIANAWHQRSDAYSSIGTLIGISAARLSFLFMDPLAALVTSGFIIKIGVKLIRANIGIMMDEKPEQALMNKIRVVVQATPGVKKIDNLKVHRRGSSYTVDLEIEVERKISVEQGHEIAARARDRIFKQLEHIYEVMVHVNPALPYTRNAKAKL